MTYTLWEMLAETPWWFYIMIIASLKLAYLSTQPKIISVRSAIFFPLITNSLLVVTYLFFITFTLQHIVILFFTLFLGIVLGFLHFYCKKIKALKNKTQFYIPGSWSLLLIVCIFICARLFYFEHHFLLNINIAAFSQSIIPICLLGLIIGLYIGRTTYLYRRLKFGPYFEQIPQETAV